jgi:hypothetical protein
LELISDLPMEMEEMLQAINTSFDTMIANIIATINETFV